MEKKAGKVNHFPELYIYLKGRSKYGVVQSLKAVLIKATSIVPLLIKLFHYLQDVSLRAYLLTPLLLQDSCAGHSDKLY